jgi:hypothetical protein
VFSGLFGVFCATLLHIDFGSGQIQAQKIPKGKTKGTKKRGEKSPRLLKAENLPFSFASVGFNDAMG